MVMLSHHPLMGHMLATGKTSSGTLPALVLNTASTQPLNHFVCVSSSGCPVSMASCPLMYRIAPLRESIPMGTTNQDRRRFHHFGFGSRTAGGKSACATLSRDGSKSRALLQVFLL